ncbi:hypothetical protein HK103_007625 [Boothiomyces macroporosus]|uniref:Bulb-type lectin domain-containing protein n=1 Tax=Boothiomyces macroporosus TaxID=261099 RepID=A0AAD5Y5T2_9FUNG|nr:hypothetical protein HK103_007625 [Boothiomyces macroporosus]
MKRIELLAVLFSGLSAAPALFTIANPSTGYKLAIPSGSTLNNNCDAFGCGLVAANGYTAMMQHDCLFAVYTPDFKTTVYKSNSYMGDGYKCFLAAQTNGQLVIYRNDTATPQVVQALNNPPANIATSYSLNIDTTGNLIWQDNTGAVVWSALPIPPPPATFTYSNPSKQFQPSMASGVTLNSDCNNFGCAITSQNGAYLAVMQHDCLFIVYTSDLKTIVYDSQTWLGDGNKCFLAAQSNGQLSIYKNAGTNPVVVKALNAVPAVQAASYNLVLQNDGNLVYKDNVGNVVWSAKPITNYIYTTPSVAYTGKIANGATLNSDCNTFGCGLTSANGAYITVMQHDCLLMTYTSDIKTVVFNSQTWLGDGNKCFLAVQNNGQVVIYKNGPTNPVVVKALNPAPLVPAASYSLLMQNDGNLVLQDNTGAVVWSTLPIGPPPPLYTITKPSVYFPTVLPSGATLNSDCITWGCYITSPSWEFQLVMQHDCILALYMNNPFNSTWNSGSWQGDGHNCFLAAQTNGQLVIYRNDAGAAPAPIWTSNPAPAVAAASYTLTLNEDGSVVWADNNGNVLWKLASPIVPLVNTNFNQPAGCPATPFVVDARLDCLQTTYDACYAAGCCWAPAPAGMFNVPCYGKNQNPWFGVPGSDPGVAIAPTVQNAGQYQTIVTSPVAALAVAAIPTTNQLVYLERISGGVWSTYHTYLMDLAAYKFTPLHVYTDIFCSGGVMMPDGTVLNVGGWTGDPSLRGVRLLAIGDDWKQDASTLQLLVDRWYPTPVLLPNGNVWVIGGAPSAAPGTNQPSVELLPTSTGLVTVPLLVNTVTHNLYPFVYYLPADANQPKPYIYLFAGASSQLFDPATFAAFATLPDVPSTSGRPEYRNYPYSGSSAMLPVVANPDNTNPPVKILICGGSDATNLGLNTCATVTPSLGAKATWAMETMPMPRVLCDLVALPDQTYLLINGATNGLGGFGAAQKPVLNPILYNPGAPAGQRFTVLASTQVERLYHSEAILAIDGRVIVSGSTPNQDSNDDPTKVIHPTERRIEAFLPPYLLNGAAAPQISAVSSSLLGYNQQFTITTTIPSGKTAGVTVSLINPGFITHNAHMGNSHNVLLTKAIAPAANGQFTITVMSPINSDTALPIYYQLWVVDNGKPCAQAQWVKLNAPVTQWPKIRNT